jgi:hypothetical protein
VTGTPDGVTSEDVDVDVDVDVICSKSVAVDRRGTFSLLAPSTIRWLLPAP